MLQLENGKEVSVKDMVAAITNAKKNEAEEEKKEQKVNMDTEVEVGEDKMPLKELVNKYMDLNNKKNAEDEEAKKKADEEKQNKEDEKIKEEEKQNAKHFDQLKNAAETKAAQTQVIELSIDKKERGKSRYSL
jgi:hypothetical protein